MTKYIVEAPNSQKPGGPEKGVLGFRNAQGRTQTLRHGDIFTPEPGDDLDIAFLLKVGAIAVYTPQGVKHGK